MPFFSSLHNIMSMCPLYNLLLTNFRICFTGYELNKFFNEVSGLLRSFFYVVGLKNVLSIYGTIYHRQLWYIMYPTAILLFWHYKFKCVPGNKLDGDINATPIFRGGKTDAGQKKFLKENNSVQILSIAGYSVSLKASEVFNPYAFDSSAKLCSIL